jgi:hypothetical protein
MQLFTVSTHGNWNVNHIVADSVYRTINDWNALNYVKEELLFIISFNSHGHLRKDGGSDLIVLIYRQRDPGRPTSWHLGTHTKAGIQTPSILPRGPTLLTPSHRSLGWKEEGTSHHTSPHHHLCPGVTWDHQIQSSFNFFLPFPVIQKSLLPCSWLSWLSATEQER